MKKQLMQWAGVGMWMVLGVSGFSWLVSFLLSV